MPRYRNDVEVEIVRLRGRPSVLARLLRRVLHGGEPGDEEPPGDDAPALSAAELRVAELLGAGRTNKEIADALELEPSTVKSHIANIYAKLNIHNRGQFLQWWTKQKRGQG